MPQLIRHLVPLAAFTLVASPLFALSAQTEFIPLESSTDDDRPVAAAFGPQGSYLYVGHSKSGTITRTDLAAGAVDLSVSAGASLLEVVPGGQELVAFDGATGVVSILSLPGLAFRASIPTAVQEGLGLIVAQSGQLAIVTGREEVAVIDLAAGAVTQSWTVPAWPFPTADVERFHLAADDSTLSVLVAAGAGVALQAYDVVTGAAGSPVGISGVSAVDVQHLVQSADRSVLALQTNQTSLARIEVRTFDSVTLAASGGTTLFEGTPRSRAFQLDRSGTRAFHLAGAAWYSFSLTGGALNASSPGVTEIALPSSPGPISIPPLEFLLSADETRLLVPTFQGSYFTSDVTGAQQGEFVPELRLGRPAARSAVGASFALLDAQFDRLAVLDAGGAGPAAVSLEMNSGLGQESDGPFVSLALDGAAFSGPTLLEAGYGSDHVARVDLDSRMISGRMPVSRGPLVMRQAPDGNVLVGHEDGVVLLIDPVSLTELSRWSFAGAVTEIELDPEPAGNQPLMTWIRTEGPSTSGLHRLDVLPGGQLFLATEAQFAVGYGNPRSAARAHTTGTLAVDWDHDFAYLLSSIDGAVEVVNLAPPIPTSLDSPGFNFSILAAGASQIRLTEDGRTLVGFLFPLLSSPGPVAYESAVVTGGALAPLWSIALQGTQLSFPRTSDIRFRSGDSEVLVDATSATDVGTTYDPGYVALRVSDGSEVARVGVDNSDGFDERSGVTVLVVADTFVVTRMEGQSFSAPEFYPAGFSTGGSPLMVPGSPYALLHTASDLFSNEPEGLVLLDLSAGRIQSACTGGAPNATGVQARLESTGSLFAGERLDLTVSGLQPGGMFGMLVVGSQLVPPFPAGLGIGELCLGGSVGRLTSQVQTANGAGQHVFRLDESSVATSIGFLSFAPGETWAFQGWHRDQLPSGLPTSNTSTAVAITFR